MPAGYSVFLLRPKTRASHFYRLLVCYSAAITIAPWRTTPSFVRSFTPTVQYYYTTSMPITARLSATPDDVTPSSVSSIPALARNARRRNQDVDVEATPPKRTRLAKTTRAAVVTPSVLLAEDECKQPEKKKSKKPPTDWEAIYSLVEELRHDRTAPCDHSGAEALAETTNPKDRRFIALLSLMLSSQTKDAVVAQAIRAMDQDGVLSVAAISQLSAEQLHSYILKVGFHNNKTKYIQGAVQILLEKYDGDVPPTASDMMELPGVGPKMAFICENIAWNQTSGIGVDTHMHRLFNKLNWVNGKTPEQTRKQLEAWLPVAKWQNVNLLWVGFGQEVQQFPAKILRKALDCSRPVEALQLLKRCGMDYTKEGKKAGMEEELGQVLQENLSK
jgi:endonuclease-3